MSGNGKRVRRLWRRDDECFSRALEEDWDV